MQKFDAKVVIISFLSGEEGTAYVQLAQLDVPASGSIQVQMSEGEARNMRIGDIFTLEFHKKESH